MESSEIEKTESLSVLLCNLGEEEAAKYVLHLMRQQHSAILKLCDEEHPTEVLGDVVCQHIAEQGLKEILDTIKSLPVCEKHYFAGAVLVAIKDIYLVKKYIWKDLDFVQAMSRLLKYKTSNIHGPLLRDIAVCVIQGTVLGGTPTSYYESITKSDVIELFSDIFQNRLDVSFKHSYEELLLSLMLLCQNNKTCAQKCNELSVSDALTEFSLWEQLDDDIKEKAKIASTCIQHMANQDSLPDHKKLLLNKFSEHMYKKNKTCKRMETIVCSYPECSKVEPDAVEGRFKKCGRCRVALYCSKDCQKGHWKSGHSKVCIAPTMSPKMV